jgi:hypothetical protein
LLGRLNVDTGVIQLRKAEADHRHYAIGSGTRHRAGRTPPLPGTGLRSLRELMPISLMPHGPPLVAPWFHPLDAAGGLAVASRSADRLPYTPEPVRRPLIIRLVSAFVTYQLRPEGATGREPGAGRRAGVPKAPSSAILKTSTLSLRRNLRPPCPSP